MSEYSKTIETEIFALAQRQYERIVTDLLSETFRHQDFKSAEAFLQKEGAELLRCLLQGFLDYQTQEEPKQVSITGTDGVERRCRRSNCSRQLNTLFGEVRMTRTGYSKPGVPAVFPLDASLNLPANKYSQGLQTIVAEAAAKESFEQVVEDVQKLTAGRVPKRQAEQLAQEVSRDFDPFYEQKAHEDTESTDALLIMTTDAKGIVVRHEDLREATRMAAAKEQHKKQTRLSPGEKKNRKRMAQVASVYGIQAHPRTAEAVMKKSEGPSTTPRPKPTNKRVWASVEKESGDVIVQMFKEARRRDPEQKRQWVALVDGNESQISHLENTARSMNLCITIVMDFIHVLEYLWKAAYALWGDCSDQAEGWVQSCATQILQSKTSSVAAAMRSRATRQEMSQEQRKPVDRCADYILKNKRHLDYRTALEKGWPIATGVIEGACRYLVKDRMDVTGARWSLVGAESVLKLRAIKSSGDFDAYMAFHERQERERIYGGNRLSALDTLKAA